MTDPNKELRGEIEKAFWLAFDAKAKFKPYYNDEDVQATLDDIDSLISKYVEEKVREGQITVLQRFNHGYPNRTKEILEKIAQLQSQTKEGN